MRKGVISLLGVVVMAACSDGGSREKLSMSGVSVRSRSAMVSASMGSTESLVAVFAIFADPGGVCPKVTVSGTSRTIRGGCTDENGEQWRGTLVAKNVGEGANPVISSSFELDGFGTSDLLIDGAISLSLQGITSDLTTTAEGISLRTEATWAFTDSGTRLAASSTLELVGQGYVDLVGQWDLDGPTGILELRGKGIFKVDFARLDSEGCAPATLDGVAVETVCPSF
jgi:hypothetical protein